MPGNVSNVSFSSGFRAGGDIMNRKREREFSERQAQLQRNQAHLDQLNSQIAAVTKAFSDKMFNQTATQEEVEQAKKDLTMARAPLFGAMQEFTQAAMQNGFMTPEEANIAYQTATVAGEPVDPRNAQEIATQAAAAETKAISNAKQADNLEQIRTKAAGQAMVRATPTTSTQNVNTMALGGADSQPENQEPFEGIGMSLMEDIRASSGIFAAGSKAISRTVGQAVEGTNPRIDAEQRVRNFNQEFKNTLTRNPRYPVKELEAISENLLPNPSAILTDPESEARKIPLLKQHLENLNEVDARTLQGNLSKKGRNDAIDRMASRQAGIDMIGDVPDISEQTEGRIEELETIGLENMTDQQMDEYLELTQ